MVIKCGILNCPCTHTEPCEAGWITLPEGKGVHPCPTCRPKLAQIFQRFKTDPDGFESAMRQYRRGDGDVRNRVL